MMRPTTEQIVKAEKLSKKGYDLCRHAKYAEALVYYKKAASLDPTNHKHWYNTAVACDRIGDNAGMESSCVKTIECNGAFMKGYVRLAKALLRQDKVDQAATAVVTGLLVAPDDAELAAIQKEVQKKQEELSVVAIQRLEKEDQRRSTPKVSWKAPDVKTRHTRTTRADPQPTKTPRPSSNRNEHQSNPPEQPAYPNLAGRGGSNHRVNYKDQVMTLIVSDSAVEEVASNDAAAVTRTQPKQKDPPVVSQSPTTRQPSHKKSITRRLLRGGRSAEGEVEI